MASWRGYLNSLPMNTVFLRKSAAILTLAATLLNTTAIGHVYADCLPSPTSGDDAISCTGTSSNVTSGSTFNTDAGNDTVSNAVGGIITMILNLWTGADVLLNEGTINNYIDFGDGDETYTYGNDAGNDGAINGYIYTGEGNDILNIEKNFAPILLGQFQSWYTNGSIAMGAGADTVDIATGVTATGSIQFGTDYYSDSGNADGNDTLTINDNAQVTGNISFGSGVDTLILSDNGGYI